MSEAVTLQAKESKPWVMLRAFTKDQTRIDELSLLLEKTRGGSWSRAHVIEIAIDMLDKSFAGHTN